MNGSKKESITWLEFVLIILLSSGGIIVWGFADQGIDSLIQDQNEARKERIQALERARLETELATVEAELADIEQKLAEEHLDMAQRSANLEEMEATYSNLHDTPPIPPEILWVPPPILERFFSTQVEAEATRQIIESLEARMPDLTDALNNASADLVGIVETSSADLAAARLAVRVAEDDLVVYRNRLRDEQLDLTRQTAAMKGIVAAYPQLSRVLATSETVSAPTGIFRAYVGSQIRLATTKSLSQSLSVERQQLISRTVVLSADLANTTPSTDTEFNWDNPWFSLAQLLRKLLITVGVVLGLIVLVVVVLGSNINRKLVFWGAAIILALLLIYQILSHFEVTLIGIGFSLLVGLVALIFLGKTSTTTRV